MTNPVTRVPIESCELCLSLPLIVETNHKLAAVLDEALEERDRPVIRNVLLRASDPMARLECVARFGELALDKWTQAGTPALRAAAKEMLEEEDAGPLLASQLVSVLRDPPKEYLHAERKRTTHDFAATVLVTVSAASPASTRGLPSDRQRPPPTHACRRPLRSSG